MHHFPIHITVPVAALLAALLLPGCEAPQTPVRTEEPLAPKPVTPEAAHPPLPESSQHATPPVVEQRPAKPLKLTIDETAHSGQSANAFGHAPAPDWLDKDQAAGDLGEAPASNRLLPDLFNTPANSKAVSVKGKILTNGRDDGTLTTVDGAGVSIQMQTD